MENVEETREVRELADRELEQAAGGVVRMPPAHYCCPVCGWRQDRDPRDFKSVEEEHKRCRPDCTGKVQKT